MWRVANGLDNADLKNIHRLFKKNNSEIFSFRSSQGNINAGTTLIWLKGALKSLPL
jgi:hypothetical protein